MQTNLDSSRISAVEAGNYAPMPLVTTAENITGTTNDARKKGEIEPLKYQPHWISGGAKHPGLIVETPGLANVALPPITYRPNLPHSLNNSEVIHQLTERQREMYNNMARAWQEVLKNFNRALDITNSSQISRRFVVTQFWAEHQRCFHNLITAFRLCLNFEILIVLSPKATNLIASGESRRHQSKIVPTL